MRLSLRRRMRWQNWLLAVGNDAVMKVFKDGDCYDSILNSPNLQIKASKKVNLLCISNDGVLYAKEIIVYPCS